MAVDVFRRQFFAVRLCEVRVLGNYMIAKRQGTQQNQSISLQRVNHQIAGRKPLGLCILKTKSVGMHNVVHILPARVKAQ